LEEATTEKEPKKKKHRNKKTKDKDRKKKRLTDDAGNFDNGAVPPFDDAMPDADNDNDEWKEVDKSGKGKTKKHREAAAERKKANKEVKKAAKSELKAAQATSALAGKEVPTNTTQGNQSTPRVSTTGSTHKKYSQYSTCFILNVGGQQGDNIPDMQRNAMKAVFSVGKNIEEIFFEPLSSSIPAPLIFSEDALPVRATKQR
jgi:hypothetical protein